MLNQGLPSPRFVEVILLYRGREDIICDILAILISIFLQSKRSDLEAKLKSRKVDTNKSKAMILKALSIKILVIYTLVLIVFVGTFLDFSSVDHHSQMN